MPNHISSKAHISKLADIEESSKGSILIIKDGCQIDSFVKIKFTGGVSDIEIGENCYLNSGTVLYSGNGIKIGDNVLIGPNCNIVPTNHEYSDKNTIIRLQRFLPSKGGIVIEDDVWLGANVTILDGAYIKKGSIIGANSTVIGVVEAYSVYAGSPAKKIKSR
jgi:acetyltransferase-like isoleucine patch superfamily enzyme